MEKRFIVIRGIPGSGKSTLAAKLKANAEKQGTICKVFEADDFFMRNGVYEFNPSKLPDAHKACLENAKAALADSETGLVIVSNTFIRRWEIEPYLALSPAPEILRMTSSYGSVHGVPLEKITTMSDNMEDIAGEEKYDQYF